MSPLASYSIVFHTMSEKPPKQMKGFGRKLLSRRQHVTLSRVAIGKRHKCGISVYHHRVRQCLIQTRCQKVTPKADPRRRQMQVITYNTQYLRDCVRKRMTVLFLYLIGIILFILPGHQLVSKLRTSSERRVIVLADCRDAVWTITILQ